MRIFESFTLGPTILVLLLISAITAFTIAIRAPTVKSDLVIWTFDARGLNLSAIDAFQRKTGKSVSVEVISTRALDTRLLSQFMSEHNVLDAPDLVEIEIGSIGKFFRPPTEEIGFRPLNDDLNRSGLGVRFLPSRLAAWSKDGVVFGLPQDVHPVSLTYRKDLFDAAGIDPARCATWPQLQRQCEQFEQFWRQRGIADRRAMMLSASAADDLIVLLQQRHLSLIDVDSRVHFADPIVAKTICFYAGLIAGNHAISGEPNPGEGQWINDLDSGALCMLFTPDWRADQIKASAPSLAGKLAMIPLPRFDPDDAPTGSWGGTMIGLLRASRYPADAWLLAEMLTSDPPPGVLPALPDRWNDAAFHQPDPFYVGAQSASELYVKLAAVLPTRVITPFSTLADVEVADVMRRTVQLQRDHPERTPGNAASIQSCTKWLSDAADDLRGRIQLGTF